MRLALLVLFLAAGAIYTSASWRAYREDVNARIEGATESIEGSRHPEAHLRILRAAIAESDYTDRLLPHLEGALDEAPSFYQPPLLMAAFYANRLERPERIRQSFEAAIARFPSNGRLHLTYAEWLLMPRASAPYRAYRAEAGVDSRSLALERIAAATKLEPDLTRPALELMLRFQVPVAEWYERLPRSETTLALMLDTVDRTPGDRSTRAQLLSEFLETASTIELLRRIVEYAERWQEPAIALAGAMKWREASIAAGEGEEIVRSTVTVARHQLRLGDSDTAYRLLRETLSTLEERSLSQNALELLCSFADEYRRRRQHAMAQGLYSEAVAMSRYHAPAYVGLARNYRATGDLENARREIDELLRFDPSNEDGRRELEELMKLARKGR